MKVWLSLYQPSLAYFSLHSCFILPSRALQLAPTARRTMPTSVPGTLVTTFPSGLATCYWALCSYSSIHGSGPLCWRRPFLRLLLLRD